MEFGSTFVLAASNEYEALHDAKRPASPARSTLGTIRRRLRSLSNAGSQTGDETCIVNLFDTYSFGRMGTFSFESLPDAVGGERAKWREQCVRDSDAILLVYDITSPTSFGAINGLYEECRRLHGAAGVPAVLCANVSDLLEDEAVPFASALAWGRKRDVPVLRTSARTGLNVDAAFVQLLRLTRRRGRNYTVTLLGAQGTGKTSVAVRFCYPDAVLDDVDALDEVTYAREIVIPGLHANSAAPQRSASVYAPGAAPGKLRKKRSISAKRKSGCPSGLGFGSRSSFDVEPPLPAAARSLVDVKQSASQLEHTEDTQPTSSARVLKADCNIVALNFGSLAPDDSKVMDVRALRAPPPMCPICGARCRGGPRCAFCGAPVSAFANTPAPPAVEEYPVDQRYVTITWALPPVPARTDDIGLTVFCVDVSAAMNEPHEMRYEHHLWRQGHGRSAKSDISRLECMQDAVLLHLERLNKYHPQRKVAVLLVTAEVECSFSGMYASHRVKDGHIRSLKQGMNHGDCLVAPYWKEVSKGYSELSRQIRHLRAREGTERAMGTALSVALGLARGHLREMGTRTEIFLCTTGACNAGIGSTLAVFADSSPEHGRAFYARAGLQAKECGASVHVVGITREDAALDVIAVAARTAGGVATVMDEPKVRREPRRADQPRMVARNAVAQLFLPRGCRFVPDSDPRASVSINVDASIATVNLPEVDDDACVSFSFRGPDDAADSLPFQAQIQYTNGAGDVIVRILNSMVPVTRSRAQSEIGANISLVSMHALRITAARAAALLKGDVALDYAPVLRDDLRAVRRLLERATPSGNRESLDRFLVESERLDCELEAAFEGPVRLVGAARDMSTAAFMSICELQRSVLASTRRRAASNARRPDRWI